MRVRDTAEKAMPRPAGNMRVQIDVKELEPPSAGGGRMLSARRSPNTTGTSQSRPPTITNYNTSGFVISWTGRDRASPLRLVVKSKRHLS